MGLVPYTAGKRRTLTPIRQSVSDGSTLSLDFTTGVLDPRLTFTRASNATYINSQGYVTWAKSNLFLQGIDLSNASWTAANLTSRSSGITNPFGVAQATELFENTTNGAHGVRQTTTANVANQYYTFSVYMKAGVGRNIGCVYDTAVLGTDVVFYTLTGAGTVTIPAGSNSTMSGTISKITDDGWYRCTYTIYTTVGGAIHAGSANGTAFGNHSYAGTAGNSIVMWGGQFEMGTTANPFIPTTTTVKHDDPRFDYDPTTLTPRGLLIEASAVNYVLQSVVNTFPSPWSTAGTNLPTTTVAYTGGGFAPDNITRPTRIQFGLNAGGSASRLLQATAYTTNPTTAAPYTVSVWMKSNTPGTSYSINIYKATGNNLVTVTDSWQRFTVVNTSGTSLVGYIYISNESASVAADILIWGAQLEAGNGASSYIPTGASTGSRVEDSATMSSVDSLGFDLYQGTFLVQGTQFKQSVSGTYARTMRLAGASEPFGLAVDGLTLFGTSRNAANASIAEATRTNVLLENFAFGFALNANNATNTMVVSRNGSSTSANRSATGPTGTVTALSFNSNSAATAYASMALRSVKFWPVAKTAAELNALTTGA